MKNILMIASEASHFKNFHIPYIKMIEERGNTVYTASNGDFQGFGNVHTRLKFRKKLFHPANIGVILKLSRLINKEGFDAVCTNSTLAGFAGRIAVILAGKKNTQTIHICHGYLFSDNGSLRSRVYLFFEKIVRRHTDLLAVMNGEDLEIAQKYSLGKKIVFINGMGVPEERFPAIPSEQISAQRQKLLKEGEEYLFLCVGEFSERKNQKAIIEALSRLDSDTLSKCRLILAGEGKLFEECKEFSKELRIEKKIDFIGHCKEMNLLYRSCDCLISASRFEGLPFNVMEALYCGENIIVSDVKGNRDLQAEHGGEIFPFGDTEGLTELMALLTEGRNKLKAVALKEKYLLSRAAGETRDSLYEILK